MVCVDATELDFPSSQLAGECKSWNGASFILCAFQLSLIHCHQKLLEILLPMGFVGVLVGIKSAVDDSEGLFSGTVPAFFPPDPFALTPLTARDYFTFMQAQRTCIKGKEGDLEFIISGIERNGYNWQVPLVKCDSTLCEREGQDASQFCEYGTIALAPSRLDDEGGKRRALEFEAWLYAKYPELVGLLPFDVVQHFDSPEAMDAYVTAVDYEGFDTPKIAMGIVWEGDEPMKYYYALRQNSTNFNAPEAAARPATSTTPDTSRLFRHYARNDFSTCTPDENTPRQGPLELSCTGQYVYNGVLTFQRLVGDFILNQTGAADAGYKVAEAGARFVQFPIKEYEDSGFYSSIAGKCSIHVGTRLRSILLRIKSSSKQSIPRNGPAFGYLGNALSCCRHDWVHCARKGVASKGIDEDDECLGI
jgi:hypothetical protein